MNMPCRPIPVTKGKGLSKAVSASGGSGGALGAARQHNAESRGSVWQRWRALLRGGDDPETSAGQKNLKAVMGILPFFHGRLKPNQIEFYFYLFVYTFTILLLYNKNY